jgi:hypothetical protein
VSGDSQRDEPLPEEGQPDDELLPEDEPDHHGTPDDEYLPEDFEDDPDDTQPRSTLKRAGRGGQMLGAAMIGLAEVLQPKPKQEIPIEIVTPGEPPNIDTDGIDDTVAGTTSRMKGPPLNEVKARARAKRPVKRRR